MRTFVVGTTKIDVIAHISREDLELDRLILRRFEGSETLANAAFQTLAADRWPSEPPKKFTGTGAWGFRSFVGWTLKYGYRDATSDI